MKIRTKSEVTIEMTGEEAALLARFLYASGAGHETNVVADIWRQLSELPEEVLE